MKHLLLILTVCLFVASCAPRVPFTQKIREDHKLQEAQLKGLQFYTSGDIVLQHAQRSEKSDNIDDGELVISSGTSLDQVIIKAGTPGIVTKVLGDNRVAVSFESLDKYLVFGDANGTGGRYTMLAADWSSGKGLIEYGGKKYFASRGSQNVQLLFKMKRLNKFNKDQRVAKGLKVD